LGRAPRLRRGEGPCRIAGIIPMLSLLSRMSHV